MASAAKIGHGTLLKVNSVTVAELTSISPSLTLDELDVTNHDSASAWREFIGGLKSMEVAIEGNFLATNDTQDGTATDGLITHLKNGTTQSMSITFADGPSVWSFVALVRDMTIDAPVDDALKFSASLRVSGVPTLV